MSPFRRISPFSRIRGVFPRLFGFSPTDPDPKVTPLVYGFIKNNGDDNGSALVMAVIFLVVATFLVTIGMKLVSNASRSAKERELFVGQAENVARAGLVDALAWFSRQTTNNGYVSAYPYNALVTEGATSPFQAGISYVDQPFSPISNTTNAQKSDTLDTNVGIVNDYPLDSGDPNTATYFARYEVRRQDPLHPNPSTTATPWAAGTPTATPDPRACHDVTGSRNSQGLVDGDGVVWNIVSTGYVYKRLDKSGGYPYWTVPFNQPPNKVVATAVFSTEFRKLTLQMPTTDANNITGAIYCQRSGQVVLSNIYCLIDGAVSTTGTYSVVAQQK